MRYLSIDKKLIDKINIDIRNNWKSLSCRSRIEDTQYLLFCSIIKTYVNICDTSVLQTSSGRKLEPPQTSNLI